MLARGIVKHLDVVEYVLVSLDAGLLGPAPYPLPLEQIEEALGDRVVVTVPAPTHRVLYNCEPSGMIPSLCW